MLFAKKLKQTLAIALVVIMTVAYMPVMPGVGGVAEAATASNVKYIDAAGSEKTCESATEVDNSMSGTWDAGWYVVTGSNVVISGRITCNGAVHLILADGAKLNASAGITCTGGDNSFTVYGQAGGTGKLEATGGYHAAGIGGGEDENGSKITINGGDITATGGDHAAGIGGANYGIGSKIYINGGKVTATGGDYAQGIGSSAIMSSANPRTIIIATNFVVKAGANAAEATIINNTGGDLSAALKSMHYVNAVSYTASIAEEGNTKYYDKVQLAVKDAKDGQTVKMLKNSTEDITIPENKALTLDLNNKVLTGSGNTSVITIERSGNLTVADNSTEKGGVITGGNNDYGGGGVDVKISATLNMTGGTIKNCYSSIYGGGVRTREKSTFNMTGGTITECTTGNVEGQGGSGVIVGANSTFNMSGTATISKCVAGDRDANGGGVYVAKLGSFNMNGGTISECESTNNDGGGVAVLGTFTMTDGKITKCKAKESGGGVEVFIGAGVTGTFNMSGGEISECNAPSTGGGVVLGTSSGLSSKTTFNMSGGIITKNSCSSFNSGSGVKVPDDAEINLGGTAKITGNKTSTGVTDNLYLSGDAKAGIGTGETGSIAAPQEGMDIGVAIYGNGTGKGAVTKASSADYHEYFTSDKDAFAIFNEKTSDTNQVVKLGDAVAKIVETSKGYGSVQKAVTAATAGQTVQMIANSTENVKVGTGSDRSKNVTLDLNGKTLNSASTIEGAKHNPITNYATLTITDSSTDGKGKITGGIGAAAGRISIGGGIYNTGGTLTITGGTITGNSASLGGGVANVENGTFIMTGGTITANTTSDKGGGVFNEGTMKVSGTAKITGNTKETGEISTENNVYLASGKTITVGTGSGTSVRYLENGASIGVTTQDVPASGTRVDITGSNNADYSEYFTSDNTDYAIINDKTSDTNQVVKLALAEPTAIIYSDGYMVFQKGDKEDATHGTVLGKYTGFTKGVIGDANDVPWAAKKENVTYVQFKDTIKPENTAFWFSGMTNLTDGDFDKLDTSASNDMGSMFTGCSKFNPTKAFPAGFGSSATIMNSMFFGCTAFNPSSAFPAGFGSKAQKMISMFSGCTAITLSKAFPAGFGSEADNMKGMFTNCKGITTLINLPSGFGAKVKDIDQMFSYCSNMTTLDISSMNTGAVTSANQVFLYTSKLQTITIGENWKFEGSGTERKSGLQFLAAKSDTTYGGHWSCTTGTNKGTEYDSSTVPNGAGTYTWSKKTTVTPKTDEFTYDGKGHRNTLTVAGPSKYAETYDPADKPTAAGTHNDTYTVTPDKDDCPEYETVTGTVTTKINKVQLTIEGTKVSDKNYDGNKTATVEAGTLSGVVEGEKVEVTASGEFKSADKGTHDVTVTYSLSGDDIDNYLAPESETLSATINAAGINLSNISATDITYGQSLSSSTITGTAKFGDSTVAGTWSWKTGTTKPAVSDSEKTEYDVTFTPTSDNYQTTDGKVKIKVKQKQLTIKDTSIEGKTYDGETDAKATVGTLTNIETGDDVKVSVKSAEFEDRNAEENKTVTVKYEIAGDDAGNYLAPGDDDSFKATISKKQLSISDEAGKKTVVEGKTFDGDEDASKQTTMGIVVGKVGEDDVTVSISSSTYANKNAEENKTVKVKYEISGAAAGNYIAPADDDSFKATISKKGISVKADDQSSYVGSDLVTNLTYKADALIGDDKYTGKLATTADKSKVGSYDITQGTLSAGDNYSITYTKGTYTIMDLKTQTLTFDDAVVTRTYGDAKLTQNVKGAETTVTYSSSNEGVATVNSATGEVTILKAGETTIKAKAAKSAEYAEAEVTYLLKVNKKQLTIKDTSIEGKTYDGETDAKATVGTLTNIETGDDVKVSVKSAEFEDRNAEENKTVTVKYEISGDDAGNYLAPGDDDSFKATISKKQLSISDEAGKKTVVEGKTFDGDEDASKQTTMGIVVGKVGEDDVTVSISSSTYANKNAEENKTVKVKYEISGAAAGNYIAPADDDSFKATISKKGISVTADDQSSYVGSDLVTNLTYKADALIGDDKYTGKLATTADKSKIGSYDITIGTLSAGDNYSITYTKGTYTVMDLKTQTLTFDDAVVTRTYGDAKLTQKVKGAETTVTYSSSNEGVATVDSATGEVTILKAGETTIKAKAAKSAEYAEAEVTYSLKVNKKQLSISDEAGKKTVVEGKTFDGDEDASKQTTMGIVVGKVGEDDVTVSISSSTYANKNAEENKTVKVKYEISGAAAGNYIAPADDDSFKATISKKGISVTADDQSSYVGSDLVTNLTYKADALIGDDKYTGKLATTADKSKIGSYDITQGTLSAGDNYSITYTKGTYTVMDLKTQTLTFDDAVVTRTYGDAKLTQKVKGAETTVTYSSSNEGVATVNSATGEVTILKAGETTIKAKAVKSAEYAEAEVTYLLTVNKKQLTVNGTTVKDSKVYDGNTTVEVTANGTITGKVGDDDVALDTATAVYEDKDAGNGKKVTVTYTIKGSAKDNYINPEADTSLTADITKREVVLTSGSAQKVYDGSALTKDEVHIGGDLFAEDEGATYDVTGSRTKIGTSDNIFNYTLNDGTKAENYEITKVYGKITVTQATMLIVSGKAYKKSIKYKWNKVSGAVKYKLYMGRCDYGFRYLKTTKAVSFTKKGLKKKTAYKLYVAAYNKAGRKIATAPISHVMTKGGKYSNATKVRARTKISMFAGYTEDVNAGIIKKDSKKKMLWKNHVNEIIRYYTGNPAVATVSPDGVVNALSKGTTYIYSLAPSGVYSKTKVVVK